MRKQMASVMMVAWSLALFGATLMPDLNGPDDEDQKKGKKTEKPVQQYECCFNVWCIDEGYGMDVWGDIKNSEAEAEADAYDQAVEFRDELIAEDHPAEVQGPPECLDPLSSGIKGRLRIGYGMSVLTRSGQEIRQVSYGYSNMQKELSKRVWRILTKRAPQYGGIVPGTVEVWVLPRYEYRAIGLVESIVRRRRIHRVLAVTGNAERTLDDDDGDQKAKFASQKDYDDALKDTSIAACKDARKRVLDTLRKLKEKAKPIDYGAEEFGTIRTSRLIDPRRLKPCTLICTTDKGWTLIARRLDFDEDDACAKARLTLQRIAQEHHDKYGHIVASSIKQIATHDQPY